jgi:hypothetical protein
VGDFEEEKFSQFGDFSEFKVPQIGGFRGRKNLNDRQSEGFPDIKPKILF